MPPPATSPPSPSRLARLVREIDDLGPSPASDALSAAVAGSGLVLADVAAFVEPTPHSYARRRVARTEAFEMLVMTWLPGQGTTPHDHAGSVSVFRIIQGTARESRYTRARDSLAEPAETRDLSEGEVGTDPDNLIHSVRNASTDGEVLVTLHLYSPPLAELRRYASRPEGMDIPPAFFRTPAPGTPVVTIVGGGFSGAMVAANLARGARASGRPLHVVILDRQTSVGEGAAYRTPDPRHLLNVPASNMSAWRDRPADFLDWSRTRDPAAGPYTFHERRTYGEYLRSTLLQAVSAAAATLSVEIRRDVAAAVTRRAAGGWRVHTSGAPAVDADAVVLATGHRPPDDPVAHRWSGSRARYIEDPWASLALSSIDPGESVALIGTGLTAIDVMATLGRPGRQAPVIALSRRGFLPAVHPPAPEPPTDPGPWLQPLLAGPGALTVRQLVRSVRQAIDEADATGRGWPSVVDGLRPWIPRIWQALSQAERSRFIRHVRPFWEVRRHRMAPAVGTIIQKLSAAGLFTARAARIRSARGTPDGVTLTICERGASAPVALHFDWVVNCTGPGSGGKAGLPAVLAGLIEEDHLEVDALGLGIRSTPDGRASAHGRVADDLLIIGTLRKPDLWESTAVPELREQAAVAAEVILRHLYRQRPPGKPTGTPPDK